MNATDTVDDFDLALSAKGESVAIMVLIGSDGQHRVWASSPVLAAASWKDIAETIATVASNLLQHEDPVAGHA